MLIMPHLINWSSLSILILLKLILQTEHQQNLFIKNPNKASLVENISILFLFTEQHISQWSNKYFLSRIWAIKGNYILFIFRSGSSFSIPTHCACGGNLGQQDYKSEIVSNFSLNQANWDDFQILKQHICMILYVLLSGSLVENMAKFC